MHDLSCISFYTHSPLYRIPKHTGIITAITITWQSRNILHFLSQSTKFPNYKILIYANFIYYPFSLIIYSHIVHYFAYLYRPWPTYYFSRRLHRKWLKMKHFGNPYVCCTRSFFFSFSLKKNYGSNLRAPMRKVVGN